MDLKELIIIGKAKRWLRTVFCLKPLDSHHQPSSSKSPHKDRSRWISLKTCRNNHSSAKNSSSSNCCLMPSSSSVKAPALTAQANHHQQQKGSGVDVVDPNKQTIASAVKSPALTAQAAAKVVKLTSGSVICAPEPFHNFNRRPALRDIAALIIQSAYRGHLARRALQALKGVVKFQALVRGHIERKRAAEWLRRIEILVRAQMRARDERFRVTLSSHASNDSSHLYFLVSRNGSIPNLQGDDGNHDKILQEEPRFTNKARNPFHSSYLPLYSYLCNNCSFTNPGDSHQTHPINR